MTNSERPMRRGGFCTPWTIVLVVAILVGSTTPAGAHGDSEPESANDVSESERYRLRRGDIDIGASVGVGLRVRFEPLLSVGLVSFGDLATLSTGLTAGFGFGLLCPLVDTIVEGCPRRVRDVIPKWRIALHSGLPGDVVGFPIELYAGGSVGPSVYFYRIERGDTVHRPAAITTTFQAFLGGRLFMSQSGRFFGYAEIRFRRERGDHRVRVPSAEGAGTEVVGGGYRSSGFDTLAGGGFRF